MLKKNGIVFMYNLRVGGLPTMTLIVSLIIDIQYRIVR